MKELGYYSKWTLRIGIVCAAIYDLFILNWVGILGGLAVLLSTFLIDYINRNKTIISGSLVALYCIYCIFALICGVMLNFYDFIPWWDLAMHLIAGIILGILGNSIINKIQKGKKIDPIIRMFFIIGIACLGGIAWEIYEFAVDSWFGLDTQKVLLTGVADTMGDIITDLIGGILAGIYFAKFDRRGI